MEGYKINKMGWIFTIGKVYNYYKSTVQGDVVEFPQMAESVLPVNTSRFPWKRSREAMT